MHVARKLRNNSQELYHISEHYSSAHRSSPSHSSWTVYMTQRKTSTVKRMMSMQQDEASRREMSYVTAQQADKSGGKNTTSRDERGTFPKVRRKHRRSLKSTGSRYWSTSSVKVPAQLYAEVGEGPIAFMYSIPCVAMAPHQNGNIAFQLGCFSVRHNFF